jgi:thioesterase domain-containing protein/acyl carrier protein
VADRGSRHASVLQSQEDADSGSSLKDHPLRSFRELDGPPPPSDVSETTGPFPPKGPFVAPRDELETRLARIWEDLLGEAPIGVDDSFMERGGDSVLTVQLFCRINVEFGIKLPIVTLDSAPTLGKLARAIRNGAAAAGSRSLVEFRPHGQGQNAPLFCLPGSGGYFLSYAKLVSRGVPGRPIFGLQYESFAEERAYQYRVEDMAAHFVGKIRTIQPEGPYWLGGYSFGGIVAFEMAQQLVGRRQEVALLALFDTWAPGFPRIMSLPRRLGVHARKLGQLDPWSRARYIADRMRNASSKVSRLAGVSPFRRGGDFLLDPVRKIEDANHRAAQLYMPRPYPERITLFRADKQYEAVGVENDEPTLGWGGLTEAGVKVHPIPGTHNSIFSEPNVRVLEMKLRRYFST